MNNTEVIATRSLIDLSALVEPIKADLAKVESELRTNLIDDNSFINDLLALVFSAGGKRIRPILVLLSAKASSPESPLNSLQIILAVLTELIHSASLVHDDVLDSASVRRGSETVNKRFSDRMAVLLGDLLFAQASICLARIKSPEIVGIYGQVLGDLCAGEIQQMKQQFSTQINWQDYIHKSIAKTASLFAAGTHSAAIINDADQSIIDSLKSYGTNLGICFQIVDDLLDYTGDSKTLGKEPGSDLRAGIITAPALFVLERKDDDAKRLEELVATKQVGSKDGLASAFDLIRKNGALEKTSDLANKYGQTAKEALSVLPASTYKQSLMQVPDYVLNRVN